MDEDEKVGSKINIEDMFDIPEIVDEYEVSEYDLTDMEEIFDAKYIKMIRYMNGDLEIIWTCKECGLMNDDWYSAEDIDGNYSPVEKGVLIGLWCERCVHLCARIEIVI